MSAELEWEPNTRLVDLLIEEQQTLSAVDEFAEHHASLENDVARYESLIPVGRPEAGQQFSFQVDLDACTGCKACVTACHSLNGLEEDETWRRVGLVETAPSGPEVGRQQTVTTACHHCAEPGCLSGCPVQAYEKDPTTGIVRHLDDQCIGCRYCQLMCPYDVPTYSPRLGIVRKCDMCHSRLAEGEAPACVQGCPNGAISIRIVDRETRPAEERLLTVSEGAMPSSALTSPTTRYVSDRVAAVGLDPVDVADVQPSEGHTPLAAMLVLTQVAIGATWLDALFATLAPGLAASTGVVLTTLALVIGLAGLGASTAHLGRPQWAFRAILGLRTSWMSREIVVLGAVAGTLAASAGVAWIELLGLPSFAAGPVEDFGLRPLVALTAAALGGLGLFCSLKIYAVTGRPFWSFSRTGFRFMATAAWAGVAAAHLGLAVGAETAAGSPRAAQAALALTLVGLTWWRLRAEAGFLVEAEAHEMDLPFARSRSLLANALAPLARGRRRSLAVAGYAGPALALAANLVGASPWVAGGIAASIFVVGVGSDLIERSLFFRAEAMPSMPGAG